MNQDLALRVLSDLMGWDSERARVEFAWLRLMSRLKFDGYRDFVAGVRFIESLADWLQQFERAEREVAYAFVRNTLVYIDPAQIQHLVELAYPETIERRIVASVAEHLGIPRYRVWAEPEAAELYRSLLRRTLILGLSDGARIDSFRRANEGLISNEQVVVATQINTDKWNSLLSDLRSAVGDEAARFELVYLLDDFVATGTTLLRERGGVWLGKLARFWDDTRPVLETHFSPGWVLCVHHYIATYKASQDVPERHEQLRASKAADEWFPDVEFSFGLILPHDLPISDERNSEFIGLVRKYYDPVIETPHMKEGGEDARLGFGGCALPLILEHNTPNNSVSLLWAETDGVGGAHPMRPLFRRRQRHS